MFIGMPAFIHPFITLWTASNFLAIFISSLTI